MKTRLGLLALALLGMAFHISGDVARAATPSVTREIVRDRLLEGRQKFGTYYSIQKDHPPLPYNPFPELPVFALSNNVFLVDDRSIDYEALWASAVMMEALSPENFAGVDYGTNLHISAISIQDTAAFLTLSNAQPNVAYDIFFTPVLDAGFYWRLHYRGATNQTEFVVTIPPTSSGFFVATPAIDTDRDWLTDGFEALVAKTDPLVADSDANDVLDGFEDYDNDGALNHEEFSLLTNPFNADSNASGVSDGENGGAVFSADGIDNDRDGQVDETDEAQIQSGPNPFSGELRLTGRLRGDHQIGIPNTQLLIPFVVLLTNSDGSPVTNGTAVNFSAFSPSAANVSYLLSNTTDETGNNGFVGQAQTYLTLGSETGNYRVVAQSGGKTYEFFAEAVSPQSVDFTDVRYETPHNNGEVTASICHMNFFASGAASNVAHIVAVQLVSQSNPSGIIFLLRETFPGSGKYVGSAKTAGLQANAAFASGGPEILSDTDIDLEPWGDPDGSVECCSADNAEETGSDYSDADAFDANFSFWGCDSRGRGRSPTPTGPFRMTAEFIQAAGVEVLQANVLQILKFDWVKNQADFFYMSTHGLHDDNTFYVPPGEVYGPGILRNQWKSDLDIAIISGCSLLDVTGDKWPPENLNRPGKLWANLGPCYLLGYEHAAPSDSSGLPEDIVYDFAFRWEFSSIFGDPVVPWLQANGLVNAWNASALVCCVSPKKAYHWKTVAFSHVIEIIEETDW